MQERKKNPKKYKGDRRVRTENFHGEVVRINKGLKKKTKYHGGGS